MCQTWNFLGSGFNFFPRVGQTLGLTIFQTSPGFRKHGLFHLALNLLNWKFNWEKQLIVTRSVKLWVLNENDFIKIPKVHCYIFQFKEFWYPRSWNYPFRKLSIFGQRMLIQIVITHLQMKIYFPVIIKYQKILCDDYPYLSILNIINHS